MDILTKELNKNFNDKYLHLKLLEVNYLSHQNECEIVFLYPYTHADMSESDRTEIENFLSSFMKLNSKLKVKFKKSFLDDYLVIKKVMEYLDQNYKSISYNIAKEDFTSSFEGINLKVQLNTADEVKRFFEANNISSKLVEFLKRHFFAEVSFEVIKDNNKVITAEIRQHNSVILKPRIERYKVNVIKKGFGGDIMPNPEYIKNIFTSKNSCILAGTIEGLKKAEFMPKKPRKGHEGETRTYYNFMLNDGSRKLPTVYFATKAGDKIMGALSDGMYVLLCGDVRKNQNDKLTMYIRKLALASRMEEDKKEEETPAVELPDEYVNIKPEKIENLKQENLFKKINYNQNILGKTFVVFDVETTGLDAESCEIVEIAAVKIENGIMTEKFETLVKPTKEISSEITKINGITNEMVKDSPKIEAVILDFFKFTKGAVLSGYNVGFDMKFVENAAQKLGLTFDNEVQDVMAMARMSGLKSKNLKLAIVCKELGIKLSNAHRAFFDTLATAELMLKLNEEKVV